jgi:hypothetical protein
MSTARGCVAHLGRGCGKPQRLLRRRGAAEGFRLCLLLGKVTATSHGPLRRRRQARLQTLDMSANQKGSDVMNGIRKTVAAATIAGSMLAGGVIGAALYGVSAVTAAAATATPSPTTPAATAPDPNAPFVSNEAAAHEATESAAREAQETAGIRPTVP